MTSAQRYRVRHETIYNYGGNVAHSHQLLHLTPRDSARQVCHSRSIRLEPLPSSRSESLDAFGNLATRLEYDSPHDRLEVLAEIEVEVSAPAAVNPDAAHPWERTRDALTYSGKPLTEEHLDACRFRMESDYVQIKREFHDYGADCFAAGRPLLAGAEDLMHKVHRDFTYAPGSTDIRTTAVAAFARAAAFARISPTS